MLGEDSAVRSFSFITSHFSLLGEVFAYVSMVGKGRNRYPVAIINWVQYLGPPGPFSFPDSRDLLEVLRRTSSAERETP